MRIVTDDPETEIERALDGDDSIETAADDPLSEAMADEAATDHATAGDATADELDLVERLSQEVAHLRACVAQLLDLLDEQSDVVDDVTLLEDRMALVERRIDRNERDVSDLHRTNRRRSLEAS